MAAAEPKRQFALDANLLFDLAAEVDAAHDFRETFLNKGYGLRLPPTAAQELFTYHLHEPPGKKALATRALLQMRGWGITPFEVTPVGHGITARFAHRLIQRALLPPEELNDGLILGERRWPKSPSW